MLVEKRVEKMRLQRMSVESLDRDSKGDDEGCIVTPWRNRMVTGQKHCHYYYFLPV